MIGCCKSLLTVIKTYEFKWVGILFRSDVEMESDAGSSKWNQICKAVVNYIVSFLFLHLTQMF